MKISCPLPAFVVALVCVHSSLGISPLVIYKEEMWISHGQGEINTYRTPILAKLPTGDLLAFCAPRKYSSADKGPKFIAQRRSTDGGMTWNDTRFIEDDYKVEDGLNLGAFLIDYDTNTSFIFFGYCQHTFGKCTSPYRPKGLYYKMSPDWGYTWTPAINVGDANPDLKESNLAPGPGFGIQKRVAPNKGRLILCGHILDANKKQMQCLYSDDHGKTWHLNTPLYGLPYNQPKSTGDFVPGENQLIELHNGTLLATVRNAMFYHCHCRLQALSFDGGNSFPVPYVTVKETLVDPAVFASLILAGDILFLSHPSNAKERVNMTLHWSTDYGETWPYALELYPEVSEYSSLTQIDNNNIGILFERNGYSAIDFYKIRLNL